MSEFRKQLVRRSESVDGRFEVWNDGWKAEKVDFLHGQKAQWKKN
ncbi:MAG: hypothetical protein ACYS8Y_13825 [Planctomycetota bacterium]|jgi:hypothetical protein